MKTIFHVFSQFTGDAETERRKDFARETWEEEYRHGWRDLPFDNPIRDSSDIGDTRPMPYIHDLIESVMHRNPRDSDVIAFTNADVCFTPGLTGWILDAVPRHGAAYTHRWDFARLTKPLANEAQVKRGTWYPGSDAFFFTAAWWRAHRTEYPDMILGREQCDEVLRQLVKRHAGVEIPCAIYHEKHESFWEQNGKNEGNRHNRRLARKWMLARDYKPSDPVWWKGAA